MVLLRLYALNATLLVVHELDSAYWHEWELFGLPGGIDLFVWLHVPLVLLVFWGFERLRAGARAGLWSSFLLAAVGLAALGIHSTFLALGYPQFRSITSIAILVAIGTTSALQAIAAIRGSRGGAATQGSAKKGGGEVGQ